MSTAYRRLQVHCSKVSLHKWLLANHLICSSKKGISIHQLARMLGVTYKTAWFVSHLGEPCRERRAGMTAFG